MNVMRISNSMILLTVVLAAGGCSGSDVPNAEDARKAYLASQSIEKEEFSQYADFKIVQCKPLTEKTGVFCDVTFQWNLGPDVKPTKAFGARFYRNSESWAIDPQSRTELQTIKSSGN